MLKTTVIDNMKLIEIVDFKEKSMNESIILNALKVITTAKTPIVVVTGDEGVEINELKLDKAYSLKETLEIQNVDTWADVKSDMKFVEMYFKRKEISHFNKCLATELEKSTNAAANEDELLSNKRINNKYHLLVNAETFKSLLMLRHADSTKRVVKVKDTFYLDNTPVCVLPSLTKLVMMDLNQIVVKSIGDIVELKDAEYVRAGKRVFSLNKDVGIGLVDTTNIFFTATI